MGFGLESTPRGDRRDCADHSLARHHGNLRGRMSDGGAGKGRCIFRTRIRSRLPTPRGDCPAVGAVRAVARLRTGDDIPDAAIAHTLQTMVLGLMQGGAWPVRILAREQITTFLY